MASGRVVPKPSSDSPLDRPEFGFSCDSSGPRPLPLPLHSDVSLGTYSLRTAGQFGNLANVNWRRTTKIGCLLWSASVWQGCAGRGPYRVTENYTALSATATGCRHSRRAVIVPELPASDRLLGDVVVACERGCAREYAIDTLLQFATEHAATRVSSLSCVRKDEGWVCVGHASATPLCDEEA